jgi:hypothetical protein
VARLKTVLTRENWTDHGVLVGASNNIVLVEETACVEKSDNELGNGERKNGRTGAVDVELDRMRDGRSLSAAGSLFVRGEGESFGFFGYGDGNARRKAAMR